ncbi:VOC family protein [Azohydromonas aeria]|uniref:VOC family protein n=1 Tax=Azohydromonas aeria TaxID=2590212 RepID=UPI0012F89969|nr:VOC family protein [Azohydromonas aeria]
MTANTRSYVEHVAVRVKDLQWHLRFFREVLGMDTRMVDGDPEAPRQVWTIGGMQFIQDPGFEGPEGRLAHLGVMTSDLEAALETAKPFGVSEMPQGRNWLRLPDGLAVEILQATGRSVDEALAVDPRA